MLKAPKFWYQPPGFTSCALVPFAKVYALGHWLNQRCRQVYRPSIPVICLGNFTVGGAGKTPTVIAIAQLLQQKGQKNIHFITRGYGGSLKGPVQVNPQHHSFHEVGEEALLLAQFAPTWMGADRIASAKAAEKAGASILLMDDGAQNVSLVKDKCLMVIDRQQGVGNGLVFPAGPLRESLNQGLNRTHACILIGNKNEQPVIKINKPHFNARVVPDPSAINTIKDKRLIAFAGLGFPQKFFSTLKEHGGKLRKQVTFPDHHPYKTSDLTPLIQQATQEDALLVTTEKDMLRIPSALQKMITPFKIRVVFDNPTDIYQYLELVLEK